MADQHLLYSFSAVVLLSLLQIPAGLASAGFCDLVSCGGGCCRRAGQQVRILRASIRTVARLRRVRALHGLWVFGGRGVLDSASRHAAHGVQTIKRASWISVYICGVHLLRLVRDPRVMG